jgi:hypothetical protein
MQQKAEVTQGQHLPIYRCQTACQVSLFVRFLISWISLPTKTTKIGTPRIKVISQYEKRKCLKSAQCNVPIQYKCSLIILESHLISDVYDTVFSADLCIYVEIIYLTLWICLAKILLYCTCLPSFQCHVTLYPLNTFTTQPFLYLEWIYFC